MFDKKLKILNALKFGEYKSFFQLQKETDIKMDLFMVLFDELGFDQYISKKDKLSTDVSLTTISSKQRYLRDRNLRRLTIFLNVVCATASVTAVILALA